jgi:hypothetical protein
MTRMKEMMKYERGTMNGKSEAIGFHFIVHRSAFIVSLEPAHDRDACAATGGGVDLKFIDEPTGAGESFAETFAG